MPNPKASRSLLGDDNNNPMITSQQDLVADAVVAHSMTDADASLGATTQAELEGLLDALGVKINAALDVLEAHGLMSDA